MKERKFTRKDLLNQDSKSNRRNKLVFNFTYHPAYLKLKHILSNINLLLTPDAQLRKVFLEVPIAGFKRKKRLKDLLVRAKVPVEKKRKQIANLMAVRENAANFAKKQCLGSCITRFRTHFNNYRSCHRKFSRGHSVI